MVSCAACWNERLALAYYDRYRLTPVFPASAIDPLRSNGGHGLSPQVDAASWRLRIVGAAGSSGPVELTMDDVLALPHHEIVAQLRCIEGWTVVDVSEDDEALDLTDDDDDHADED